jgi:hypothetical protein
MSVYYFAGKSKMTLERLNQYVESTDLSQLSDADRERAIEKFAEMVNALSAEDRMKWRREEDWKKWFAKMTEAERAKFIEKTLPTGFKQMLDAFGQLPPDQRKKMVDDAVNNLKQASASPNTSGGNYGASGPPPLSPELEQQVREIGLTALYTQSTPETKAELAPVLEQLEMQIHSGRMR